MKKPISLKLSISLAVLFLGIAIVFAYSLISRHFFFLGMDNIVAANLERAAETYIDATRSGSNRQNTAPNGYIISHEWQQQPEIIQQTFKQPKQSNQLYKHTFSAVFTPPEVMYFVIKLTIDDESVFVSRTAAAADASRMVWRNIRNSVNLLLIISSISIVILALVIWLILRRVSQPISQLVHWMHSLNTKTLANQPPDFYYPELNEMADLIRNSLTSSQQSLEREERFLGFASHELRTPISIIRNNIELLAKLKQSKNMASDAKFDHVIERIDRASLTMKHLSETLLWLSRDNNENLSQQTFKLDQQIEQLVSEMQYLLSNKPVELRLDLSPCDISQSQVATQIVLGNLIRNAFQHTWEGEVLIRQRGHHISIENHCQHFDSANESNSEQGFGLGLQLTEQLCQKLHWHYLNTIQQDGHIVTLTL